MSEMSAGDLIAAYVKLREKKKEIADAQARELAPYNDAMAQIENALLIHMRTLSLEALKADSGTAYVTTRTSSKVDNWDAFVEFVKENDAYHFLERRCSKQAVEEFLEATKELPPGVSVSRDVAVNIRKN